MKKEIKERVKCSARFLAADGKNSKLWKQLVEDSSFEERVLIVTKVLDNGANIEDEAVKHIVLPFCTRVDLIQMLGRKRMIENQEISVYAAIPPYPDNKFATASGKSNASSGAANCSAVIKKD